LSKHRGSVDLEWSLDVGYKIIDIKVLTTEKRLLSKVLNLRIQSHVNYACAILYKLTFLVARLGIVRRRG